jgi:hypothetical protein
LTEFYWNIGARGLTRYVGKQWLRVWLKVDHPLLLSLVSAADDISGRMGGLHVRSCLLFSSPNSKTSFCYLIARTAFKLIDSSTDCNADGRNPRPPIAEQTFRSSKMVFVGLT